MGQSAATTVATLIIAAMIAGTGLAAEPGARRAPSERNLAAFVTWLQALDQEDPRSIDIALDGARNLLKDTDATRERRLKTWAELVALHQGIMKRWDKRVAANLQWSEALNCRFAGRCPAQPDKLPDVGGLLRSLAAYGGVVAHDARGCWLGADKVWLARRASGIAPEDVLALIPLRALDAARPLVSSGVLVTPMEPLRARLMAWHDALVAHPTGPHRAEAERRVADLLAVFLDPARWTPGGADQGRMDADRRQSYRRLLASRPNAPFGPLVKARLRSLTASQAESPELAAAREAVDHAAAEVRRLRSKLVDARANAASARRVVSAFSRWAKASDRRLAWLATGLSRDEAQRLSEYASEHLFPHIEQMMMHIGAAAGQAMDAVAPSAESPQRNLPGGPRP